MEYISRTGTSRPSATLIVNFLIELQFKNFANDVLIVTLCFRLKITANVQLVEHPTPHSKREIGLSGLPPTSDGHLDITTRAVCSSLTHPYLRSDSVYHRLQQ